MKILDRYIGKQIILTILVVAFALLGFDLFFNLVHELKAMGRGQYNLPVVLTFLMLTIPTRLYTMFPWSALIGSLIGLGVLAKYSELIVMRTAGVSVFRITGAVLKAALILLVFVVFLGEGVAPIMERWAQNKRLFALSGGQAIETAFGIWVRQGQEFMHIQTIRANGELEGITRYQFDHDRKLKKALFAQSAIQQGKDWRLEQVTGTEFLAKETHTFQENTQIISHLLDPEILQTAMVKHPERLSLLALWRTIRYRLRNELNAENYELAFWSKIFQPVVILMMVFLAVPFVFGPLRSVSVGSKALIGVVVAFVFHTLNSFFAPLAIVYQLPPLLAVLLPIVAFSGLGFWMLRRL
jgi:lipopolysaccharide export system permease protein